MDQCSDEESHDERTVLVRSLERNESPEYVEKKLSTSYEEAIALTGYGCFHYKLLILCGWALSSDAIEVLSISFVIPIATCDLQMSDSDKGWLNASVFLGMMLGGYVWGVLADLNGRRAVLLWSLSLNALGVLASSVAQSFWLFVLCRFVSGIGVGGSMPVIFAYYTEFQPKSRRGSMISLLATFWMSGNIIAAALAWLIIPTTLFDVDVRYSAFVFTNWRLYLVVCVLPCLTSAFMFVLMPESPKFLMEKGREQQALQVLRQMYLSNGTGTNIEAFEGVNLDMKKAPKVDIRARGYIACCESFRGNISKILTNTLDLFRPPLKRTSIITLVIFFTLSFGYYGMFMWFPELFQRMDLGGGSPCDLGTYNRTQNATCTVASSVYLEGFLTALANLPGNIFTFFVIDRLGRRLLLSTSMVLSGVSVFFVWLLKTRLQTVIMSCIFSGVSVIGWNVLDVLNVELYPTNLRTSASGFLSAVSRIAAILANLTFGALLGLHCAVPMLMVASLMCFGGLVSIMLPNTMNVDLQ